MNKRAMLIRVALPVLIAIVGLTAGCAKPTTSVKPAEQPAKKTKASPGHTISAKDRNKVLRDAKEAIALLQLVREDTGALNAFLAEPLLKQTAAQITADAQAGRVKVRRLTNVKLEFKNSVNDVAGVTMAYTDESYYVNNKTGRQVTRPTKASQTTVMALRKIDGNWKIFSILGKAKPQSGSKKDRR